MGCQCWIVLNEYNFTLPNYFCLNVSFCLQKSGSRKCPGLLWSYTASMPRYQGSSSYCEEQVRRGKPSPLIYINIGHTYLPEKITRANQKRTQTPNYGLWLQSIYAVSRLNRRAAVLCGREKRRDLPGVPTPRKVRKIDTHLGFLKEGGALVILNGDVRGWSG